jgi:hypothetical protein
MSVTDPANIVDTETRDFEENEKRRQTAGGISKR